MSRKRVWKFSSVDFHKAKTEFFTDDLFTWTPPAELRNPYCFSQRPLPPPMTVKIAFATNDHPLERKCSLPRISVLCSAVALRVKHSDAENIEWLKYILSCPFQFEVSEDDARHFASLKECKELERPYQFENRSTFFNIASSLHRYEEHPKPFGRNCIFLVVTTQQPMGALGFPDYINDEVMPMFSKMADAAEQALALARFLGEAFHTQALARDVTTRDDGYKEDRTEEDNRRGADANRNPKRDDGDKDNRTEEDNRKGADANRSPKKRDGNKEDHTRRGAAGNRSPKKGEQEQEEEQPCELCEALTLCVYTSARECYECMKKRREEEEKVEEEERQHPWYPQWEER